MESHLGHRSRARCKALIHLVFVALLLLGTTLKYVARRESAMANELQAAAGLLLIFFLPGFTLIRVLFPRKEELNPEYGLLYQIALGMVMSLVIVVLLGFFLTSMTKPTGGGYFDGPTLWSSLGGLTVILFVVGWWRGAYPFLGKIHPSLLRVATPVDDSLPKDRKVAAEYRKLASERQTLLREARLHEKKATTTSGDSRDHHLEEKRSRLEEIAEIDSRLDRLREGIVDEDERSGSKGEGAGS
ncbi:MAG TPA: DUF1616 domain-containing protein [Thermoplasmata archaeon]|nr:DUF1616 domain-containing protein [Thermoplasmata archaeon]